MKRVIFATVLGAGLLAGCEPDGTTSSPNRTTSTPSGTTNRQTQPSTTPANNAARDTQIVNSIRQALTQDQSLSAETRNTVKIECANGVVTLSGEVATQEEKTKIEQLTTKVPGVTRVENNLDVKG